jgi:hypothetical protein
VNRHERKTQDRILALLEQVVANQNKLLEIWLGSASEPLKSEAIKGQSYDDAYYITHLQDAAKYGYDDAEAILKDPDRLENNHSHFRE